MDSMRSVIERHLNSRAGTGTWIERDQAVKLSCVEMMLGDQSLEQKFVCAGRAGFDGLDLRGDLLADRVTEAKRFVDRTGVEVPAVYGRLTVPLVSQTVSERVEAVEVIRRRLRDAAAVGARQVVVVPIFGGARIAVDRGSGVKEIELALLLVLLDELAQTAQSCEVSILLEPLHSNRTHLLNSPSEAAELTRALGRDEVATMMDFYHVHHDGQDAAQEVSNAFDQLRLVHLSGPDRQLPGANGIELRSGLASLERLGYSGYYGFECTGSYTVDELAQSVEYVRTLTR